MIIIKKGRWGKNFWVRLTVIRTIVTPPSPPSTCTRKLKKFRVIRHRYHQSGVFTTPPHPQYVFRRPIHRSVPFTLCSSFPIKPENEASITLNALRWLGINREPNQKSGINLSGFRNQARVGVLGVFFKNFVHLWVSISLLREGMRKGCFFAKYYWL